MTADSSGEGTWAARPDADMGWVVVEAVTDNYIAICGEGDKAKDDAEQIAADHNARLQPAGGEWWWDTEIGLFCPRTPVGHADLTVEQMAEAHNALERRAELVEAERAEYRHELLKRTGFKEGLEILARILQPAAGEEAPSS